MSAFDHSLALSFARISRELVLQPDRQDALQRTVELAPQAVPGCEVAGNSLRAGNGTVHTPASSDPLALAADDLQYRYDEGPCLEAVREREVCLVEDVGADPRWPDWAPRAAELGVRSVLSVRLAPGSQRGEVLGGLNLYSRSAQAYDEQAVETARLFAHHAATALTAATELEGLRTALHTRHQIGVAQGILMHRYGLDEERAFELLRRQSQDTNTKLRAVATRVISQRGEL